MRFCVLGLGLLLTWTTSPAQQEGPPTGKAKLVAKGNGYLIHAIDPSSPRSAANEWRSSPQGLIVTHTSAATGEMKVLAASESKSADSERFREGRWTQYHHVFVAELAADNERLYVLNRSIFAVEGGPAKRGDGFREVSYRLHVFSCADGRLIHSQAIKAPRDDVELTPETAPLKLVENGVQSFGHKVLFKGMERIAPGRK